LLKRPSSLVPEKLITALVRTGVVLIMHMSRILFESAKSNQAGLQGTDPELPGPSHIYYCQSNHHARQTWAEINLQARQVLAGTHY
jgi:hypothetical protein